MYFKVILSNIFTIFFLWPIFCQKINLNVENLYENLTTIIPLKITNTTYEVNLNYSLDNLKKTYNDLNLLSNNTINIEVLPNEKFKLIKNEFKNISTLPSKETKFNDDLFKKSVSNSSKNLFVNLTNENIKTKNFFKVSFNISNNSIEKKNKSFNNSLKSIKNLSNIKFKQNNTNETQIYNLTASKLFTINDNQLEKNTTQSSVTPVLKTTIKTEFSLDYPKLKKNLSKYNLKTVSITTTNNPFFDITIQSLHSVKAEPLISLKHSDENYMVIHQQDLSSSYLSNDAYSKKNSLGPFKPSYNATRDHVKLFTCGKFYYRTFHLDAENDVLYVGAMDRIYKLNLSNVNRTQCEADSIYLEPHNSKSCISKGKSEQYECRNHVRVIQRIEGGKKLYVCGTNAHSPKDWILNPNLTELNPDESYPGIGNGIAKCPFDPEDNSTAVWVEHGNPGDLPALYSGSVAEFTRADSVIFRTNLYNFTDKKELYPYRRTVKYDSKWLDKPHFVGSFDIGEHVYFFFRESAVEYINCGKNIFSRVARVCKKDIGGKNILAKNWASFLKARLNCSIPGEFPFYFNEIQHVTQNPNDPNTFYGVFSTSNNGLTGSAVCSFTLETIEKVFLGKFKEQVSSSSQWLPVLSSKVPTPRPGSCHHNTQQLPDSVLNFIRSHPLMDEAVANQGNVNDQYHQTTTEQNSFSYFNHNGDYFSNNGNSFNSNNDNGFANDQQPSTTDTSTSNNNNFPIFYKKDLIFTKIAVDYLEVEGMKYKLFYIGTSCGKLIKLVQWTRPNGTGRSFVLDVIDIFNYNMPGVTTPSTPAPNNYESKNIRAIEISSKHRSIYVATDYFIKQISLLNCKQRYNSCVQCVRDPHCGWDQNAQECKPFTAGLLQDVTNVSNGICDQCAKQYSKQVNVGEALHLPCNVPSHLASGQSINTAQQPVSWHFTSANGDTTMELKLTGNTLLNLHLRQRFVQTSDGGLVLLGATTKEHGFFECRIYNKPLFRYQIIVDTKTCDISNEKDFRKVYADWCQQFQKYKLELKKWQAKQAKCEANANSNNPMNMVDYSNLNSNINNNYINSNTNS